MTDISKAAAALSKKRKRIVGGFADRELARKASAKGVAARKKKRQADKAVEDLKI